MFIIKNEEGEIMEEIMLEASDSERLTVHVFEVENAKAVVQVIHGMEEHQERYEPFIEYLNENGFSVVSSDMRGHGKNAKTLGYFKNKDGYKQLIQDQVSIVKFIKEHFKNLPVYIFAHSMGTIITRVLLQKHSNEYDKVVLSGYPCYQSGAGMGIFMANLIKTFRGGKYKSKFINKLSVGAFNKLIDSPKTEVDWISHDEENVRKYLEDDLCGFGFTCSAYGDLFHLVKLMHNPKEYKNVNEKLKLLLICGEDDPCVGGEKGACDSQLVLTKAGFNEINTIFYKDMRHEILNEKDKQKVYDDTVEFLNR